MEDPRNEIADIVRALVTRPSLEQQASVLQKYFSPKVKFFHYYIDTLGLDDLTAIYQFAETVLNYQRVVFKQISYDEKTDIITLHMSVYVKPFIRFWTEAELEFLTLLELEDYEVHPEQEERVNLIDGFLTAVTPKAAVTRKRIKVQRDYFERQPALLILPVIGDIYNSHELRFFLGFIQAFAFKAIRDASCHLLPTFLVKAVTSFLSDKPLERCN